MSLRVCGRGLVWLSNKPLVEYNQINKLSWLLHLDIVPVQKP